MNPRIYSKSVNWANDVKMVQSSKECLQGEKLIEGEGGAIRVFYIELG